MTSVSWFTDADLIAKLTIVEDQFVERKSKSDRGGWLRTTVAFANSAPIGYPAVLFIGVSDDGTIADNVNVEETMKSFSDFITASMWPPIYAAPRSLTHNGKECIAVIIPGSEERPHFAGKAYVRRGTQSIDASNAQFTELIAQRLSKVRELLAWKTKVITLERLQMARIGTARGSIPCTVIDCNQFYLTVDHGQKLSIPLPQLEISFDHQGDRLKIVLERN